MKRKQKIALGVAIAAISTLTLLGSGMASAHAGGTDLAAKIATKFNLSQTDVQKVVDDFHTEEKATRVAERATELQAKVDAGTITAAQKTLIENKMKEVEAEREANRDQNLTSTEMKAKMETSRTALEKWATDNGIDISLVMPGGHGMGRGNGEGGHGMGKRS
jgi:hypothetical protein